LTGENRVALIDPGPTSTLATLRAGLAAAGLRVADLDTLLLTHIHLDHAGVAGPLVRENPRIRVYVHARGAPHVIDPRKLVESATRLYGADMDRLWGEVAPVPAANVTALEGGERIDIGSRRLDVAYTPGHASHHVSYLDPTTGVAFVGDTAGIRIGPVPYVQPPTPPPDVDLEAWDQSLATIAGWRPEQLFLTHFGPANAIADHVEELRYRLREWSEWVRESLDEPGTDAERASRFAGRVGVELRRRLSESQAELHEVGGPPVQCWYGLARYWRKRTAVAG
jgi:glyoxylase-like metal-dependent hydrolase (beta-lactamase superfamily II)